MTDHQSLRLLVALPFDGNEAPFRPFRDHFYTTSESSSCGGQNSARLERMVELKCRSSP